MVSRAEEKAREELARAQARKKMLVAELYSRLGVGLTRIVDGAGGNEAEGRTKRERGDGGTNRGSGLHSTEDKRYTKRSTTGDHVENRLKVGRDDAEIRRELLEILKETAGKLMRGKKDWRKVLLRMHRELGEFLEESVEE